MKLGPVKIIIQTTESIKDEWKAALKGKKNRSIRKGEIVLTNLDDLSKIFSKTRLEILQSIISKNPKSIYELAKLVNRDFKNVYSDVTLLVETGLVELKNSGNARGGLIPIAKYSRIELDLAA